jgi:hypothetical protein
MAFDPTKPANGAPIVSAELRNQFNALNDANSATVSALNSLSVQVNGLPTPDDVTDAINANAAGPVGAVNALAMTVSSPPTQAQVQAIANKIDELLTALKRL